MSNDMLIYHSYILFCEVFVQIFAHLRICFLFYWLGRVFMYLGYNLLSDLPITYQYSSIYWIFSSILWLAFCLFMVYFEQKVLILMKFSLSVLCFMEYTFLWLRNIWMFKAFKDYFLLYIVLEVLCFVFTSVTHLGLILVYDRIKACVPHKISNYSSPIFIRKTLLKKKNKQLFILYQSLVNPSTISSKRLSFPCWIFLAPLLKHQLTIYVWLSISDSVLLVYPFINNELIFITL